MYRVGIALQFGLAQYGIAATVALPPHEQVFGIWHENQLRFVAANGEEVDVEAGHTQLTATIILRTVREPALIRWIASRARRLVMVPNYHWATEQLPEFEQLVVKRIAQIQKIGSGTGGNMESVIWDWEPGQAVGRVAIQHVTQRLFYPFTLRGHTLGFRDRISNVYVPVSKEIAVEKFAPRPQTRGELFPVLGERDVRGY